MCCFSRPVPFVGSTKIFARAAGDGRQLLAYSMSVEVPEELAMVLPLPVPPDPPEDAVTFIDLEGYERFFGDLEGAFPPLYATLPAPASRGGGPPARPKLKVHDVGMFEASFVPRIADFDRLDPRFRLPDGAWDGLPRYADYGFAVFKLKPARRALGLGSKRQTVHPMALSFPRRDLDGVFFPTVHIHDGALHPTATFGHALYLQADDVLAATLDWTASTAPLGEHVDAARARGLIDPARGGFATAIAGPHANEDVWLRAPAGVAPGDLRGRGDCYEYRARGTHAQRLPASALPITGRGDDDAARRLAAWQETARERFAALCRGLRGGLPAVVEANRDAWQLAPLRDDLPRHFVNGDRLWKGDDWQGGGGPGEAGGPGRLRFRPFTDTVELQEITLGFDALPAPDRLRAIMAALAALLDRSVA
jgi:hypothetical protein